MYGNILFDNNEDKVNFNSYKGCMIITFLIVNFVYYIIGEVQKEPNISLSLKINKMSFIIHFNDIDVKITAFVHLKICWCCHLNVCLLF